MQNQKEKTSLRSYLAKKNFVPRYRNRVKRFGEQNKVHIFYDLLGTLTAQGINEGLYFGSTLEIQKEITDFCEIHKL